MAKFYGIGVGPGDSSLLTLKAVEILSTIDVLLIPDGKNDGKSLAFDIVKDYLNPNAVLEYLHFPMVLDKEVINKAGYDAAAIVSKYIDEGKDIAFITLGDTSIYSTYSYIVDNLSRDIEIETIPGITSFCAAAALINRPLCQGDEIFTVIPATKDYESMKEVVDISGGCALMKVYNHSDKVVRLIEELKLDAAIIKRVGQAGESVSYDIEDELNRDKQYFSIVIARKGK